MTRAHPYMANSVAEIKEEMLAAIGAETVDELFAQIPDRHRLRGELHLPPALDSEVELARHLRQALARNESCESNLSFLGGGCWQHYVPAVCDEVVRRSEFLTPVWGTPASDYGRNQAWFEFCSQLGELLDLDFVGLPVYSWGCAAGHAVRMAARLTGRGRVLVPASLDPERLAVVRTFCEPRATASHIEVTPVAFDSTTGRLDLDDLEAKLGDDVAAVYVESPGYLGVIEADVAAIV
jgi:glycine dehydrogenase subunit 1